MPRRTRSRRETRIEASSVDANLGDDYKFTRDPKIAAERAMRRKARRERATKRDAERHVGKWTLCLAPNCKFTTLKELLPGVEFPLCAMHAAAVWESVELADADTLPDIVEAVTAIRARRDVIRAERRAIEAEEEREWREDVKAGRIEGAIYFVRLNGMVKVGWSSVLERRLKAYGASAEVLCHYPAYRQDELNLHKQLKPALARGREWYEDGAIIQHFIEEVIAKHGPPTVIPFWTKPKNQVVASKHNKGIAS